MNKNLIKSLLLLLLTLMVLSCSVRRNQKKGTVVPKDFDISREFITLKTVIVLPFEVNGVERNFIFDTGADYSMLQQDSISGKKAQVDGASKRSIEVGSGLVASMKIGYVDFKNTIALNGDMLGLKSQIPNFGGLIGQSIISKANWLIDYPNKRIRISNKNLADASFDSIKIKTQNGAPYTFISIDGVEYKVIIDFGSSSAFNIPEDSDFGKKLLVKYSFKNNERERYTLGGLQKTQEKVGIIPVVKLGRMNFENVSATINVSSQPRIGIGFFKDCEIYIDNISKSYKIKMKR